ncbi:bifunctional epoxide hydrolase 2-like [Panicum miliaceum]|uniref:Bifunctional epoxide hydrolase 2-like n=1 Tax=Panicum miliaceum TaxID=4540 RepID=A0A3L6T5T4_PANMI|nr:bifunctional epoxide hydrolase 2-like [Panicum miliaceum]
MNYVIGLVIEPCRSARFCAEALSLKEQSLILAGLKFYRSEIPIAKLGQEIMDLADDSTPMPYWFREEDLSAYTNLYEKSGFITALQIPYRTKPAKAEYAKPRFAMPMFAIMGQKDYILKFPALKDYISSEKLKEIAPDHEITYIPEGSHFVQEQFPEFVNQLMIDFVCKHA